jgi:hypothetical protein
MSWKELHTSRDLEDLLRLFGNFHDACVREVHVSSGHSVDRSLTMTVDWRTTVHVLIQRQFVNPSAIELRFEEVVGLRVNAPSPTCEAILLDAALFLREGVFYWADRSDWTREMEGDSTWVSARRLYWRDASDWMGSELRYRVNRKTD